MTTHPLPEPPRARRSNPSRTVGQARRGDWPEPPPELRTASGLARRTEPHGGLLARAFPEPTPPAEPWPMRVRALIRRRVTGRPRA